MEFARNVDVQGQKLGKSTVVSRISWVDHPKKYEVSLISPIVETRVGLTSGQIHGMGDLWRGGVRFR
ncbi:MAG TPA: hypothetical protein V6C88_19175 [Chroococcidiopsis sp.]